MIPLIKVLVVDDSALTRQILSRALSLHPRIEIVGTASDGVDAIEKAKELQPDVITLDVEMPGLSGLEALPFLLKETDARVIMLTSLDDPGTTYEALDAGAVDFIVKPRGGFATSISDLADVLVKQIKTAYRIAPEKRYSRASVLIGRLLGERGDARRAAPARGGVPRYLVALAASTGGPPALERVFAGLSAELPAAFVVVQHLPAGFSTSLVDRLQRVTDLTVVEAEHNAKLTPGTVHVAPHGVHTTVARSGPGAVIRLVEGEPMHGLVPAADPLFASLAEAYGPDALAVTLTGMGSDGAAGMTAVDRAGGVTIAQDEATSVVWGMPGAAVRRGAAHYVLPLEDISAAIRADLVRGA